VSQVLAISERYHCYLAESRPLEDIGATLQHSVEHDFNSASIFHKNITIDNVQKHNNSNNVPSSRTFRPLLCKNCVLSALS
jgi:hypothetical protein